MPCTNTHRVLKLFVFTLFESVCVHHLEVIFLSFCIILDSLFSDLINHDLLQGWVKLNSLVSSKDKVFSKTIGTGWNAFLLLLGGLLGPAILALFLLSSLTLVTRSFALSGHTD